MNRFLSTLGLLTLAASVSLAAAPPPLVNYQGVLRDTNDQPLDGSFDVEFHLFDAPMGGGEILVDAHTGADAVQVDGGLFSVALGSGLVADGAGVFPGDPYVSLTDVFQDFSEVWLELVVEGETLSPRTRVVSSAYALNASTLDGLAAGDFLDTSASDQTKLGGLAVGGLEVDGSVALTNQFFTTVAFSTGGVPASETLSWDGADNIFQISDGLQTDGPLIVGDTVNIPVAYNRFSASSFPSGSGFNNLDDLYVGGNFEADGTAYFSGTVYVDNDGPDGDQHLWFYNDGAPGEELKWDEAGDRFEFSDSLAIAGSLRTGQTQGAPEAFNHLGDLGEAPDSDDMGGPQDLYVEGDVEIEETLYLDRELIMMDLGPDFDGDGSADDANQWIFFYDNGTMDDEWIEWENNSAVGNDRFEFSDSVHVFGDLSALNKNFVQNHPYREDLEIVYTSLEGDEAAVFTRGHARLVDGEARVPLEESFAWVANPEIGLTAHLTPRGSYAELYVVSLTPEELVVRAAGASPDGRDAAFDYIVHGLRLGYESQPVVRLRTADSPLPTADTWASVFDRVPEAAALTPAARFERMATDVPLARGSADAAAEAEALRTAIGRRDREDPGTPRVRRAADAGGRPEAERSSPSPARPASPGVVAVTPERTPQESAPRAVGTDPVRASSFHADEPGIAGRYPTDDVVEPGDVVVMTVDAEGRGRIRRADRGEDPTVVGVATAGAGVVLDDGVTAESEASVTVAMTGIVPCKVDATYGPILPGDLLVASPTPGHAMRSAQPLPGTVVGKALTGFPDGQGTIAVLVFQR